MSGKGGSKSGDDGVQMTQKQVDEVLGIMRDNMNKVLERDDKLSNLEDRADNLDSEAQHFGDQTKRIKKKYWWKNMKTWIITIVVVLVIVAVIVIACLV